MQELIDYLRENVPLTREMDIQAGLQNQDWLELAMPLTPNLNDKQTAFGGSLATLCTLSGWCICAQLCKSQTLDVDISVIDSQIRYRLPVKLDPVRARAYYPGKLRINEFIASIKQQGHARLTLNAEVLLEGHAAVNFEGRYYVRLDETNSSIERSNTLATHNIARKKLTPDPV